MIIFNKKLLKYQWKIIKIKLPKIKRYLKIIQRRTKDKKLKK